MWACVVLVVWWCTPPATTHACLDPAVPCDGSCFQCLALSVGTCGGVDTMGLSHMVLGCSQASQCADCSLFFGGSLGFRSYPLTAWQVVSSIEAFLGSRMCVAGMEVP